MDRLRLIAGWRPQWRPDAVLVIVLAIGVLALLVFCVYVLPQVLVPDRSAASLAGVSDVVKRLELEDARLKQRNDVRTTLLQGLAGAVLVVGAFFTWRQVSINREGQITERFTRAIDQLGSDHLDVRLGAIYALERIARDSPKDRPTIANILTAYIRTRSPWPPRLAGQYQFEAPLDGIPPLQMRVPDIQASLNVLGRGQFSEPSGQLDLREVDLRKAHLEHADLQQANLGGANLAGAKLAKVKLNSAILIGANLEGAYFGSTSLDHSILSAANLQRAVFSFCSLAHANLVEAKLNRATLTFSDLTGALLSGAQLVEADLMGSTLNEALLGKASWGLGMSLQMPFLLREDLRRLVHSSGANLKGATLAKAKLAGASADSTTIWPDGFDHETAKAAGIEFIEEEELDDPNSALGA